jgi:hypothetical protein
MNNPSIMLVGCPDSGKTNYLARLWSAVRNGKGILKSPSPPNDIIYVENVLSHLLQGKFAPRSDKNLDETERNLAIPLELDNGTSVERTEIVVPDVSGELWKTAVETFEISQKWMDKLKSSSGALLFIRVLSPLNITPLDWVTAKAILKNHENNDDEIEKIPTQVALCELLRFLEHTLTPKKDGTLPRVAVMITAWDQLDKATSKTGPMAFLEAEYPLFAGRIRDIRKLNIQAFGVSILGGDPETDKEFKERFLGGDFESNGYVIRDTGKGSVKESDITRPVAWIIDGSD